jgi:hypothetical protein
MKNAFSVVICATILVSLVTGCSTFNSPSKYAIETRIISIDSDPSGANVYQINPITDEKTLLGTTPLTKQPVPVITGIKQTPRWTDIDKVYTAINQARVVIMKPGYKPYIANFDTDPNKTTFHKVTLTKE